MKQWVDDSLTNVSNRGVPFVVDHAPSFSLASVVPMLVLRGFPATRCSS